MCVFRIFTFSGLSNSLISNRTNLDIYCRRRSETEVVLEANSGTGSGVSEESVDCEGTYILVFNFCMRNKSTETGIFRKR